MKSYLTSLLLLVLFFLPMQVFGQQPSGFEKPEVSKKSETVERPDVVESEVAEPEADEPEQETKLDSIIEKTDKVIHETADKVSETLSRTRGKRAAADYLVLLNYSALDLIVPSKYGFTVGLIETIDTTWELEYLRGSLAVPLLIKDIGEMTDQRLSLIRRSYFGKNSLNLSYGISYFDYSMHLGDELINRLSGGNYPNIDLVQLESIGAHIGIGNRWTFKHNITLSVDWISWSQPLIITRKQSYFLDYADNQQDRDNVERAMKVASYFPRLSFFKLQFGILF